MGCLRSKTAEVSALLCPLSRIRSILQLCHALVPPTAPPTGKVHRFLSNLFISQHFIFPIFFLFCFSCLMNEEFYFVGESVSCHSWVLKQHLSNVDTGYLLSCCTQCRPSRNFEWVFI